MIGLSLIAAIVAIVNSPVGQGIGNHWLNGGGQQAEREGGRPAPFFVGLFAPFQALRG